MAFKRINAKFAKEGMELANDVYDDNGRMLIPFGTVINNEIIRKLQNYNIQYIKIVEDSYIENSLFSANTKSDVESGYYERIKSSQGFKQFEKSFIQSVSGFENEINDIVVKNKAIDIDQMLSGVNKIIDSNKTGSGMLDILNCMRGYDDQTFVHSMNVALICHVMTDWFRFSKEDAELITAAGLLHDIGKVKIPKQIICKPGKLTDKEYAVIKYHPVLGYDILKNQKIDQHIKNAALMHHERYNGKGYPNGIIGDNIDVVARIVAIADVYDAMTANRVYREGMSPFAVLEYFEQCIDTFDPRFALIFLEKTAESYIRNSVMLNNGETGTILMINNSNLSKPVVMVNGTAVDLSKNKDIKITKLL